MTEFRINVALDDAQLAKLLEMKSLANACDEACGFPPHRESKYELRSLLRLAIELSLGLLLDKEIADYRDMLSCFSPHKEAGDVPARNPSSESGPGETEMVSNAEETSVSASAVSDAREEEPETLISVRDASGVVRMVTLDEMEEMREAAQGIYAGEPPEPDFVSDDDFLSSFPPPAPLDFWSRRDAMKYVYRFDCHGQRFYVCARSLPDAYKRISRFKADESLSFLGISSGYRPPRCRKALRRVFSRVRFAWGKCERKDDFPKPYSYDAESWSVSPMLVGSMYRRYRSIVPVDYSGEPPEPDFEPDAPEEEAPETVSNAEDNSSLLIKDNSDVYFAFLEAARV